MTTILTPFIPVGRAGNPVEVATLTYDSHAVMIEITQIAWKESTNSMAIRHLWRVLHVTNRQGDLFRRELPEETPVVAALGITEPIHNDPTRTRTEVYARREALAAARKFLNIKKELRVVGDELDEEDVKEAS